MYILPDKFIDIILEYMLCIVIKTTLYIKNFFSIEHNTIKSSTSLVKWDDSHAKMNISLTNHITI